ncbi:Hypothetical predicted protein [Cloeon dipterum]|uniref:Uncharacterized protein n=1 Tax=Cloeon dipterum TaxID=197152 RepID=A0A8S1BRD5_9INSE|nr:Hypothetical predicted protein [Cloeon dipterum]
MLLSGIGTIHWDAFIFMGAGISASGFIIFAVCSASHQLSCKIKTDFVEAIQVTKKLRASKPTIKAINKLLLHLIEISPPLNLDGYMTIDRSLLTTLLATFITTTIVLLQMQIGNNTFSGINDLLEIRRILFK